MPIRRQKRGAALVRDDRSASRNSCRQLFGDLTSPPAATTPAPPLTNLTICKTSQDPALSCQPQKCPLGRRYASALAGTKAAKTGHFSALLVLQRTCWQKSNDLPRDPLSIALEELEKRRLHPPEASMSCMALRAPFTQRATCCIICS